METMAFAFTREIFYLFLGAAYFPGGLAVLLLINTHTERVDRCVSESIPRLMFLLAFWPITFFMLFLPNYKVRRGAARINFTNQKKNKWTDGKTEKSPMLY